MDSPDDHAVEGNDSGEVAVVPDKPDSVVRTGMPVQFVADNRHIVVVVLHMQVLVEVLMGHRLVELMVHFDLVVVVHLESVPVSGMAHQLIEVKKSTFSYHLHIGIANINDSFLTIFVTQLVSPSKLSNQFM